MRKYSEAWKSPAERHAWEVEIYDHVIDHLVRIAAGKRSATEDTNASVDAAILLMEEAGFRKKL